MKLKSFFDPTTRTVQVQLDTDLAPASPFVELGLLTHEEEDNASGMQLVPVSHAIYQHVQEQLYVKHGIQNMQIISIEPAGKFKLLESMHIDRGQTMVKPGENIVIKGTVFPEDATIDGFYCHAHNPALVTITEAPVGTFTVVFNGDGETILEVGLKNTQLRELVPVEARTIVRQA